jgi:hypothetical protein
MVPARAASASRRNTTPRAWFMSHLSRSWAGTRSDNLQIACRRTHSARVPVRHEATTVTFRSVSREGRIPQQRETSPCPRIGKKVQRSSHSAVMHDTECGDARRSGVTAAAESAIMHGTLVEACASRRGTATQCSFYRAFTRTKNAMIPSQGDNSVICQWLALL